MVPWMRADVFRDTRCLTFRRNRTMFRHFSAQNGTWKTFRGIDGSLGDHFGTSRAPLGSLSCLEGSLGDPFVPSKAPLGTLPDP